MLFKYHILFLLLFPLQFFPMELSKTPEELICAVIKENHSKAFDAINILKRDNESVREYAESPAGLIMIIKTMIQRCLAVDDETYYFLLPAHDPVYNSEPVQRWLKERKIEFAQEEQLRAAVHAGDHNMVKTMLKKGVNVDAIDDMGVTALHVAAREGHSEIITLLVEHGAEINKGSKVKLSALTMACRGGHVLAVQKLLQLGANPNKLNFLNEGPLVEAVQLGDLDIIFTLLMAGANTEIVNNAGKYPYEHTNKLEKDEVDIGAVIKNWPKQLRALRNNRETYFSRLPPEIHGLVLKFYIPPS